MKESMLAMVLEEVGKPLEVREVPVPRPGPRQVLIRVRACGVCRTDLHITAGELPRPRLPLVPGHQIAGVVAAAGDDADRFRPGERVGAAWLGFACGSCRFCRTGRENLCDVPLFTGYTIDGGYAEYAVADERFCYRLPEGYSDPEAAPLLCAGLIGYRAYRLAGEAERIGIYGFGAAAHLLTQVAVHERRRVFAFTRPGDRAAQDFALRLGAIWAGGSGDRPPEELDAAIIFAPVGSLVPAALAATAKGGTVVVGGIHLSDIPSFPYRLLWEERQIRSVANLTRRDGEEFLEIAPRVPVKTRVETFPLREANRALDHLQRGKIEGAAVLVVSA